MRRLLFVSAGILLVLLLSCRGVWCWACGPWLSAAFLSAPQEMLAPPESHFVLEMKQVRKLPDAPSGVKAGRDWPKALPSTLEVDVADLKAAWAEAGGAQVEQDKLLEGYGKLRRGQLGRSSDVEKALPKSGVLFEGEAVEGKQWLARDQWPEAIPMEFQLYVEGAERCYAGDGEGAKELWKRLLALPIEQRKYRSTWAAWMMGRMSSDLESAQRWYREVGRLVEEEGCVDSLRLAAAAAGRLAKFESDPAELVRIRFHNFRENQRPRYEADLIKLRDRLASAEGMASAAVAADVVETVSTLLMQEGRTFHPGYGYEWKEDDWPEWRERITAWFDALKAAKTPAKALPPQLGIAAYRAGDFGLAETVLTTAEKTWQANWILGKLAMQKGRKLEAAGYLAAALKGMSTEEKAGLASITEHEATVTEGDWWYWAEHEQADEPVQEVVRGLRHSRLLADLGTVKLSQNDFLGALKLFVEAECPHDAAYVAERLLSTEELLSAVRRWGWKYEPPLKLKEWELKYEEVDQLREAVGLYLAGPGGEQEQGAWTWISHGRSQVLYLLARRLGRERLFKDARPFYPAPLLPYFDRYVALYRRGHGNTFPQEVKASSLWEAAQLERALGLDLFGTSGEPDGMLYGGMFGYSKLSEERAAWRNGFAYSPGDGMDVYSSGEKIAVTAMPKPTPEEVYRARQYELRWNQRFHYRFTAADLAWKSAQWMPGNSENTAAVYCEAGRWIYHRDPKAADRFYKAMIWRNWETSLAREADKKRWFPNRSVLPPYNPFVAINQPLPGDPDSAR